MTITTGNETILRSVLDKWKAAVHDLADSEKPGLAVIILGANAETATPTRWSGEKPTVRAKRTTDNDRMPSGKR